MPQPLPYQIASLCYLFDDQDHALLLHRAKPPNQHLYSPVGGKLHMDHGESPAACAVREIHEETGLRVDPPDLHLTGIVSETAYENTTHWLMFLFEVTRPVAVERDAIEEGRLEWHSRRQIDTLPLPQTDRLVIWPLFWRYRRRFFCAHIHWAHDQLRWRIEQPLADAHPDFVADSANPPILFL